MALANQMSPEHKFSEPDLFCKNVNFDYKLNKEWNLVKFHTKFYV